MTYSNIDDKYRKAMKQNFDWGIKPMFQYNLEQNRKLSIDLHGVGDNIPQGIEDGTILLDP